MAGYMNVEAINIDNSARTFQLYFSNINGYFGNDHEEITLSWYVIKYDGKNNSKEQVLGKVPAGQNSWTSDVISNYYVETEHLQEWYEFETLTYELQIKSCTESGGYEYWSTKVMFMIPSDGSTVSEFTITYIPGSSHEYEFSCSFNVYNDIGFYVETKVKCFMCGVDGQSDVLIYEFVINEPLSGTGFNNASYNDGVFKGTRTCEQGESYYFAVTTEIYDLSTGELANTTYFFSEKITTQRDTPHPFPLIYTCTNNDYSYDNGRVTGTFHECIQVTAVDWNSFIGWINILKVEVGLGESVLYVSIGDKFTATLWNNVIYAVWHLYKSQGLTAPSNVIKVKARQQIKPAMIDNVNEALKRIQNIIYNVQEGNT